MIGNCIGKVNVSPVENSSGVLNDQSTGQNSSSGATDLESADKKSAEGMVAISKENISQSADDTMMVSIERTVNAMTKEEEWENVLKVLGTFKAKGADIHSFKGNLKN